MSGIYEDALINNMVTTEDGEYISILEWAQQKINTSSDKELIVNVSYMKKILGPEFKDESHDAICVSIHQTFKKYGTR